MRITGAHGGKRRLGDVAGRGEVRLADLEMDDVATLALELARAGEDRKGGLRAQVADSAGQRWVHGGRVAVASRHQTAAPTGNPIVRVDTSGNPTPRGLGCRHRR